VKVKKEVTGRLIFQQKEQGKWHILKMTQKTMAWNQERTRVVKTYKHSCHSILSLRPREKKKTTMKIQYKTSTFITVTAFITQ
jgi:hypothetical protein